MAPAYLTQAPVGIPGSVTRPDVSQVEPAMLVALASVFMQSFGQAVRYVAGGIQQFTAALTKADFAGVLVREAPAEGGNSNSGFSDTIPNPSQVQGFMTSGYVSVLCTAGTPARGGAVFVRTIAAALRPIGAFEAAADGGNSFALDKNQAEWASDGVDANNNAELRLIAN